MSHKPEPTLMAGNGRPGFEMPSHRVWPLTAVVLPIAAALMFAGCYNPDLSRVRYTCDPSNPFCPDGLKCVSGICGGVEMPTPSDMATASGDMSTPAARPACARGTEAELSARMSACAATLNGEYTDALCRPGWRLCAENDPAAKDPPGFFVANVRGLQVASPPLDPNKLQPDWTHGTKYQETTRYLFGRGSGNYVEPSAVAVHGFGAAMECSPGATYVRCPWQWGDDRDAPLIVALGWLCCNY